MKHQSKVEIEPLPSIDRETKLLMLGSCFTTEIGTRLKNDGYSAEMNPFGILFNPASIASSIIRMESGQHFTENDVIFYENKYSSFFHHSHFSRPTQEEFLKNANEELERSVKLFKQSEIIIVTFGTAWVFRHLQRNLIVSNCHKIPSKEFIRERLSVMDIVNQFSELISRHREKRWIFTVSPIRHLSDGCHGNQISKATLLLAIELLKSQFNNVYYFPSYEIMMDELRDFNFYAEDTVHPSLSSLEYIYRTFKDSVS